MIRRRVLKSFLVALATASILPQFAWAHFIWLKVEPAKQPGGAATIRAFFNEQPEPDAAFVKYTKNLQLKVDGQVVPSTQGEASRNADWAGKLPATVDTEHDLGVKTKGGKTYRLRYAARAQSGLIAPTAKEGGDKLRVRLIEDGDKKQIEVLFDGKPVAKARIKVYPASGEPTDAVADEQGRATIAGIAEGTSALWANWVDATPGTMDGKDYPETRYYATFTYNPTDPGSANASNSDEALPTRFATIPAPAVNSFGGAVLGKWLYVYSGHTGRTHRYGAETTTKSFRRLNLEDRTTWEDLPVEQDLQGGALVADDKYLYRVGGMFAKNKVGEAHDLYSVADFSRFDPEAKTWTKLADMPEARSTHDAVVVGRTVYVTGGWTMAGDSKLAPYPTTALAFDLDHPEGGWKVIPQPFQRRAHSMGEQGGKLFVLGGLVAVSMKVVNRVDVYDPKTGTWAQGPDLPAGLPNEGFGTSAFTIDGRLYYSGATGRIYRLNPAGDAWESIGAWALPRTTHRVLPGPGHTLLAVGGNVKGKQTPVIEAVTLPETTTTAAAAGE
ncbi:kelch repeat-containing protein [Singulisphaera acidiphila]|uniref:Kelch motif protein n=1 Tax=Singulisphaera acidiphila (strain ATCC BAA-1392 / DSM 18658 / VKM B-2454 / MOB10) TaxID=886293 RepID=L0DQH7_SINAD|nr:kelch repeat-containing protein [Singulisphaera acidiphila]AGA31183.1 Kelch motif protein [Singulisphaera acidiphila DSM 18658]